MDDFKLKLPVGIENFEEIRTEGFYYIDKTGLITDLLQNWGKVNLFTRPRRFGKSLNISMLKTFFEIGSKHEVFDGLEISKETELCEEYMGKFPVISVSLKDVEGDDFASACSMLSAVIGNEAMRFQFLLESERLTDKEKKMYEQLTTIDAGDAGIFSMSEAVLAGSMKALSMLLHQYYGRKVIILIDEYDVPLAKANEKGYYDQMVTLIRKMFGNALKTNEHMYFAVLTGCLCIAKESIFTGLNNLKVMTIADVQFDEHFGFVDNEVRDLLEYYGLSESYDIIKEWYDGYRFGNADVYCPWDVICCCDKLRADKTAAPSNFWANTSGNDIVRRFIQMADAGTTKRAIEQLVAGEAVTREIHQELTYKELYDSVDNVWSVLFSTGYLTKQGKPDGNMFQLVIPNMEIRSLFTGQIMKLFRENTRKDGDAVNRFCEALKSGDAASVEKQFTDYLKKTISIRDTFVRKPGNSFAYSSLPRCKASHRQYLANELCSFFYHGILLGILGFKSSWNISSNKESGDGYNDIQVEIEDEETGIVIEVKYAHDAEFETECKKALGQIEASGYVQALRDAGMQTIWKYGIACYKKRCKVLAKRDE